MLGLVLLVLIFLPMFLVYYWLYMGIKKELDKIETLAELTFQRPGGDEALKAMEHVRHHR